MCPSLKTIAMTIETVAHDMTAMHLTDLVDLPKDDMTFISGSDEIVLVYTLDLPWRKVESPGYIRRKPSPESATW